MNYEKYEDVGVSYDCLEYVFTSCGPKGLIRKNIQFEYLDEIGVYNLSFGNLNSDGSIDDLAVNDNKDRNKILATIVYAISIFCKEYPEEWIYFTGSTPERTRLYRMAISLNLDELSTDFEIVGVRKCLDSIVHAAFEKGGDYFAFLIKGKKS